MPRVRAILRAVLPLVLATALLATIACGKKAADEKAKDKNLEIAALRTHLAQLEENQKLLQEQIAHALTQQANSQRQLEATLNTLRATLEAQSANLAPFRNALTGIETPPEKTSRFSTTATVLIVIAIPLILWLGFLWITGSDENDDEDIMEDGFFEENDLGTVRYPGREDNGEGAKTPPPPD